MPKWIDRCVRHAFAFACGMKCASGRGVGAVRYGMEDSSFRRKGEWRIGNQPPGLQEEGVACRKHRWRVGRTSAAELVQEERKEGTELWSQSGGVWVMR